MELKQEVKIVSSELLTPARVLDDPPKFKLTAFDRLMRLVPYQQRVLFYKSLGGTPYPEIIKLLKNSLAEVLVVFYPFAGRIQVADGVALELDCGLGQSVRFTEAVTDATLEELGELRPCNFCDKLCDLGTPPPKFPWTPEIPLLFVQVTKFSCGGISLGFGFSHQAVDGVSAWHFMISWAEMARTGSVQVPPQITYDFEGEQQVAAVTAAVQSGTWSGLGDVKPSPVPVARSEKQQQRFLTKQFTLGPETINKLKSEASAATGGKKFSTFVVVSAYFWRKVTLARQLPATAKSSFVSTVNIRGRFSSLSKSYFGNAIAGCQASVNVGDFEEHEGISHCASVLQASIAGFNNEAAINVAGYFGWLVGIQSEGNGFGVGDGDTMYAIGSPRHPVYETDFGFGKPDGVTFGSNDLGDGKMYLFPSAEGDGGVIVTIVLKPESMQRLEEQEN